MTLAAYIDNYKKLRRPLWPVKPERAVRYMKQLLTKRDIHGSLASDLIYMAETFALAPVSQDKAVAKGPVTILVSTTTGTFWLENTQKRILFYRITPHSFDVVETEVLETFRDKGIQQWIVNPTVADVGQELLADILLFHTFASER